MRSDSLRARLDRRLALSLGLLLPAALVVGWLAEPLPGLTLLLGGLSGLLLARAAASRVTVAPLQAWLDGEAGLADAGDELAKVGLRQLLAVRRRRRAEAERDASRDARSRDAARVSMVAEELRRLADGGDPALAVLASELDGEVRSEVGARSFSLRELVGAVLPGPLAEADARGLPLGVRIDPRLSGALVGDAGVLGRVLVAGLQHVVAATREGGVELRLLQAGAVADAVVLRIEIDGYAGLRRWGDGERTPGGLAGARALLESLGGHLVVEEGGACVGMSVPLLRADSDPVGRRTGAAAGRHGARVAAAPSV